MQIRARISFNSILIITLFLDKSRVSGRIKLCTYRFCMVYSSFRFWPIVLQFRFCHQYLYKYKSSTRIAYNYYPYITTIHIPIRMMTRNSDNNNTGDLSSLDKNNMMTLSFPFRDRRVPVSYVSSVTTEQAIMAIQSEPFISWYRRCEKTNRNNTNKQLEIHSVIIQGVDMFGARKVGFVKILSNCTLLDSNNNQESKQLPGICFLRGNAVSILVALFCDEEVSKDGITSIQQKQYGILVEQPRIPIGVSSIYEIPAGMIDDEHETVAGIAVKEMEEECGIKISPHDLIDLTELALEETVRNGHIPIAAIAPSAGGCDEFLRYMYLEKNVTLEELTEMKGRLTGLRDHGEYITLHVVPMSDLWKVSGDAKAMISLFLLDQLREEGKLPPAGQLATWLKPSVDQQQTAPPAIRQLVTSVEPIFKLSDRSIIPQLGFGLYLIPNDESGEKSILEAIHAGYRHFDSAAFYGNEQMLGAALRKSGIPREEFFIVTKVWNDSLKEGRIGVRNSVMKSIDDVNFGGYFNICYIHWPVPGHFIEAYHELELIQLEGKIRSIGLSNFSPQEYEELVNVGAITVSPVVNQMEVSVVMYRPELITYFQSRNISVIAYKPLNRGKAFQLKPVEELADKYSVSPSQIMLRWCLQKGLIVICKTSNSDRMKENRSITQFALSESDIAALGSITTDEDKFRREQHELDSKRSL